MAAKTEHKNDPAEPARRKTGIYIDSSALAKIYMPEPESKELERFLRGRQDLMISELCITEVASAAARRKREGLLKATQVKQIHEAILADAESGYYRCLDISPLIHRDAEHLLLSIESAPLRTLDALHIALALSGAAERVITFDVRMASAAAVHGLEIVKIV
jgi:predicted nucleic acid-binding protein